MLNFGHLHVCYSNKLVLQLYFRMRFVMQLSIQLFFKIFSYVILILLGHNHCHYNFIIILT